MKKFKISVSTNPPPAEKLIDYIAQLNMLDVDYIHCDVMDGKFVKSTTFDHKTVKEIRANTNLPLDVHLMIKDISKYKKYIKSGANIVSVHIEALSGIEKSAKILQKIAKLGAFPGIVVNPATPVEIIYPLLPYSKVITLMSVVPGKSGQSFIEDTIDKIKLLKAKITELGFSDLEISVDGGINSSNVTEVVTSGADIVAVGNYLYSAKDRAIAIKNLRNPKA